MLGQWCSLDHNHIHGRACPQFNRDKNWRYNTQLTCDTRLYYISDLHTTYKTCTFINMAQKTCTKTIYIFMPRYIHDFSYYLLVKEQFNKGQQGAPLSIKRPAITWRHQALDRDFNFITTGSSFNTTLIKVSSKYQIKLNFTLSGNTLP